MVKPGRHKRYQKTRSKPLTEYKNNKDKKTKMKKRMMVINDDDDGDDDVGEKEEEVEEDKRKEADTNEEEGEMRRKTRGARLSKDCICLGGHEGAKGAHRLLEVTGRRREGEGR